MNEREPPTVAELQREIERLNKVVQALMNRVERSSSLYDSYFDQFQATVMLEELVRRRTQSLEYALAQNRSITRALREAEQKFHGLLDQTLVGIMLLIDGRIQYANPKLADMLGYSAQQVIGLTPADWTPADDLPAVLDITGRALSGEFEQFTFVTRACRKDGRIIDVEVSGRSAIDIGGRPGLICVTADITEKLRAEREIGELQARLQYQAIHDALTGLHNRLFLDENLEREIALAKRHGYPLSAVIVDVDFFKSVNDRYGHLAGDAVLKHLAEMLRANARASDIVCRFGGEEFVTLLPATPIAVAEQRADALRLAFAAQPVIWQEQPIVVTASFGVAGFPQDADNGADLIGAADAALYASKASGRNRVTRYDALAVPVREMDQEPRPTLRSYTAS